MDKVHLNMMVEKFVQLCIRICVWCKSILWYRECAAA